MSIFSPIDSILTTLEDTWKERSTECERLTPNRQYVIYGCGTFGRPIAKHLQSQGATCLCFAVDSPDPSIGTECDGIPIVSLQEAVRRFQAVGIFIVTFFHAYGPRFQLIRATLRAQGCEVFSYLHYCWKFPEKFLNYYFVDLPSNLISSEQRIHESVALFKDQQSIDEYLQQIRYRAFPEKEGFSKPLVEPTTYWPNDLYSLNSNTCFIDCGAYTGDTLQDFLEATQGSFRRYYAFEPDPSSYRALFAMTRALPNPARERVVADQIAVGRLTCDEQFSGFAYDGSSLTTGRNVNDAVFRSHGVARDASPIPIRCIALDDMNFEEPVTVLKMDIEGAEIAAIEGARKLIQSQRPVIAACVYHTQSDLWNIPHLLSGVVDDYDFYLRRYSWHPWDTVLFAIPHT